MFVLDSLHQLTQEYRATNTRHILQTDFRSTGFNKLVSDISIIFYGMTRRESNTKGCLRNHTAFLGILDRRNNVTHIIQSTENTGNIHSLFVLHLIHQFTHIGRNRIHAQSIQATVKHMSLNTGFMQRFCKSADSLVRVFSI